MPLATANLKSPTTRRQQLLTWMHSLGGGVAVIPTAPERTRNRDNHHSYRHDSDFYYLTGFSEAHAWLVLVAGEVDQSILFCERERPRHSDPATADRATQLV